MCKNSPFCRNLKMFLAIYVWNLKMFDLWRCKNLHTQVKMRMEILSLEAIFFLTFGAHRQKQNQKRYRLVLVLKRNIYLFDTLEQQLLLDCMDRHHNKY